MLTVRLFFKFLLNILSEACLTPIFKTITPNFTAFLIYPFIRHGTSLSCNYINNVPCLVWLSFLDAVLQKLRHVYVHAGVPSIGKHTLTCYADMLLTFGSYSMIKGFLGEGGWDGLHQAMLWEFWLCASESLLAVLGGPCSDGNNIHSLRYKASALPLSLHHQS